MRIKPRGIVPTGPDEMSYEEFESIDCVMNSCCRLHPGT